MNQITQGAVRWWPAILRCAIKASIAAGGVFYGITSVLTPELREHMTAFDWIVKMLPVAGAFLSTVDGFMDPTLSKMKETNGPGPA